MDSDSQLCVFLTDLLQNILRSLRNSACFLSALRSSEKGQTAVSEPNQKLPDPGLKVLAKRRGLAVQVLRNELPQGRHLVCDRGVSGLWAAAQHAESCEADSVLCRPQSQLQRFQGGATLKRPRRAARNGSEGAQDAGPGVKVPGLTGVQAGQQRIHRRGENLKGAGQQERRAAAQQEGHVRRQSLVKERLPTPRPVSGQIRLSEGGRLLGSFTELSPLLLDQTPVQL